MICRHPETRARSALKVANTSHQHQHGMAESKVIFPCALHWAENSQGWVQTSGFPLRQTNWSGLILCEAHLFSQCKCSCWLICLFFYCSCLFIIFFRSVTLPFRDPCPSACRLGELESLLAGGPPQLTTTSANGSTYYHKNSPTHQSTNTVLIEKVFASPFQQIPNDCPTTDPYQPNICQPNFYPPGPLIVDYGQYSPYFIHLAQTGKCYSVPSISNTLVNPKTIKTVVLYEYSTIPVCWSLP